MTNLIQLRVTNELSVFKLELRSNFSVSVISLFRNNGMGKNCEHGFVESHVTTRLSQISTQLNYHKGKWMISVMMIICTELYVWQKTNFQAVTTSMAFLPLLHFLSHAFLVIAQLIFESEREHVGVCL